MATVSIPLKRATLAYAPHQTVADVSREVAALIAGGLAVMLTDGQTLDRGDLLAVGADATMVSVPLGRSGAFVQSDGTDVTWSPWSFVDNDFLKGDLIIFTLAQEAERLAVGTASPAQVLGVAAGLPSWQTASTYLAHNLLSATHSDTTAAAALQGALIYGSNDGGGGSAWTRLTAAGVQGAILYGLADVDGYRIPAWLAMSGTTGAILHRSSSALPEWATTLTGTYTFSAAGTALTVTNNALISGNLTVSGWGRFGTATDTATAGDLVFGLTGAARGFYDQSVPVLYLYSATNAISVQLSQVASTNNILNASQLDIDTIVRSPNNANLFVADSGLDALGFGTTASSTSLINIAKAWTATSGNNQSVFAGTTTNGLAANSTSINSSTFSRVRHTTAFNLSGFYAFQGAAETTAGFSAGTLSAIGSFYLASNHAGAGAVTDWYEWRLDTPIKGGGASTPTRYTQILLADTGTFGTTNMAIRQQGTNAHNRFQGGFTAGADAIMTTGFVGDIVGDLRVSSGLNCGGTTAPGNGEAIITTSLAVGQTGVAAAGYVIEANGKVRVQDVIDFNYALTAADTNVPVAINTPTGVAAIQAGWLKIEVNGVTSYVPCYQ